MKKTAVIGAGESGTGAAVLARKLGDEVFVSDRGTIAGRHKAVLNKAGIEWEEGKHSAARILAADEVVKSPGVPESTPLMKKIGSKGIPVIAEIELAWRHCGGMVIGVTGSNGKSTTASLIHHVLQKAGKDSCLCGNIGRSFAAEVASGKHDIYVVELSSFQLDDIRDFRPDTGVLLNITPDHLDRYKGDFNRYAAAKLRIALNMTARDKLIYCMDDEVTVQELRKRKIRAEKLPFTTRRRLKKGGYEDNGKLFITYKNKSFHMTIHELALQGRHNLYNSMAAGITARSLDIRKDIIRESLADFQNIEHRLEFVANVHGIEFINDSKATNVNSAWYALESMHKPVIWIAGGVDKGNDYAQLEEMVREKVKAIICLGKNNKKIHKAFGKIIETIVDTSSAKDAVNAAYRMGKKGDVVLLAPACASFDLFRNFEERGRHFKTAVKAL